MKKIFIMMVLSLILIIPATAELAVNIGGLYTGPFKVDNSVLSTYYTDSSAIVSFSESNNASFDGSSSFGFNAGISLFLNYKLGFGVNASFLKTSFDVISSFNWNWEWWDGDSGNIAPKSWANTGTVSSIPISFNLIYRIVSNEKYKFNFFAGPTVYLTTVEMDGNGGYADGPLLYEGSYYIDWYDLPLEVSVSKTVFGGNAGVEFEYMFSESMNLYFSAAYYFAGDITLNWEVKPGQYTGEFGSLVATITNPDLLPGYSFPVKLSTFAIGVGIKVYL